MQTSSATESHLQSCSSGKTSVSSQVQGPEGEEPTQTLVAIDSLGGKSMHLYLHKRKGFETEDVLEGDLEKEGEETCVESLAYMADQLLFSNVQAYDGTCARAVLAVEGLAKLTNLYESPHRVLVASSFVKQQCSVSCHQDCSLC